MNWLLKIERLLRRLEFLVAGAALITIVVSTAIAVTSRNVFNSPIIWTGELSILAQVWLTFIGASAVYKERGHVGMAGLGQALPPRLGLLVTSFADIALAVLLVFVAVTIIHLMSNQWAQTLSTLGLPRALSSLPVAWGMCSITFSAAISTATQLRTLVQGEAS